MVSRAHIFWLFGTTTMMIVGASASLLGLAYGTGFSIVAITLFAGGWWVVATLKVERSIEQLHTYTVERHPRVLTMVPIKAAKLAARQRNSKQQQVNNYLTSLALMVKSREGYCECCGTSQPLLSRYPFDPHFHTRDCQVAIGWREYGKPETCPWGILFDLPQPVLVSQLSPDSIKGLYRFAVNYAETEGYGDSAYFRALGTEYLRHEAISQSDEFLERLGRKVAQEYRLEEAIEKELVLTEN